MSRADDVADAALRHGIRISVAESLTSGLVASALGKGHEAATWFAGAVVAYRTDVKTRVLGVREGVERRSSSRASRCHSTCSSSCWTGRPEPRPARSSGTTRGVTSREPAEPAT